MVVRYVAQQALRPPNEAQILPNSRRVSPKSCRASPNLSKVRPKAGQTLSMLGGTWPRSRSGLSSNTDAHRGRSAPNLSPSSGQVGPELDRWWGGHQPTSAGTRGHSRDEFDRCWIDGIRRSLARNRQTSASAEFGPISARADAMSAKFARRIKRGSRLQGAHMAVPKSDEPGFRPNRR